MVNFQYGRHASRRGFLGTVTVAGAALTLGLPRPALMAAGKAPQSVNVAFFLNTHPTMIAKAGGWFEKEEGSRMNWTEVGSGAEINTAVVAGSIDIGIGIGSAPTAAGISQKIAYEVVALSDNIGPAEDLAVRQSADIKTPADLRGKKVATPFGSTSHFRLLGLLKVNGLTQKDVTVLDLKPDAALAAWIRGDIDACYVWNPARSKMIEAGGVLLPTWSELDRKGYVIADLVVARTAFSREYPDVVTGFIRAHGQSLETYRSKPDEAAVIVAQQVGADVATAKRDLADYEFVQLADQLGPDWLGPSGKPGRLARVLQDTANFLVEQKSIRAAPEMEVFGRAISSRFIEQALKA